MYVSRAPQPYAFEHYRPAVTPYILGSQPFGDLDVLTRPPTLIPRWETEEWVLQLTRWLAPFLAPRDGSISRGIPSLRIADLCTGSGCIALLLASTLPTGSAKLIGVDRSLAAYTLASDNHTYNRSKLRNPLTFIQADVLAKELPNRLAESFARLKPSGMDPSGGTETRPGVVDLVVANPPYVAGREFETLEPEVRVWEDRDALVPRMPTAEVDAHILDLGVEFYMRLIPTLVEGGLLVTPDSTPLTSSDEQGQDRPLQQLGAESAPPARPKVVLEIGGRHQTRPVAQCLLDQGFDGVGIWSDLAGVERALVAW
ncbi:hypothetical protein IWQ60_009228 [Tieghemiomyces parasiticus]|uniref:S-adenosyl-L-methionine-dependent methyltransferase n=1 Tax=Tieghemiomyces parasiticus TaxID=78921 RepID=A0A9W8DQG7_9FUNG|nr:hypothetical protein IWQ60_009228 [Tieghemiomyces parasiticus]